MSAILSSRGLSAREPKSSHSGIGLTSFSANNSLPLTTTSSDAATPIIISLDNVHNMSIFELRQSLKCRGLFGDDYTGPINHEILMREMVLILKRERDERDRLRLEEIENKRLKEVTDKINASSLSSLSISSSTTETITASSTSTTTDDLPSNTSTTQSSLSAALLEAKLLRKAEALARSQARVSSNPNYFQERASKNLELKEEKEKKLEMKKNGTANDGNDMTKKEEGEENVEKEKEEEKEENSQSDKNKSDASDPFSLKFRSKIGGKYA